MIENAALIIFPALMAYAASSDLLTMTISNRISIALVVSFLALAFAIDRNLMVAAYTADTASVPGKAFPGDLACAVQY